MKGLGKDLATSLTALVFAVVGVTGVMMFFHLLDNYTKSLHEILGLVFVAAVFAHIFVNWKLMKKYFSKKVFGLITVVVVGVSAGFIADASSTSGPNPKGLLIEAVLNAPLNASFEVLHVSQNKALEKLEKAGVKVDESTSISAIAKTNKTSPFRVVSIITAE